MRYPALFALLSVVSLFGQQPQQQVTVRGDVPPAVSAETASAVWSGPSGNKNVYYWIVARFASGAAPATLTFASGTTGAATLSGSNYVTVSWQPLAGATGYDVLQSGSPANPAENGPCVSCAVAVNVPAPPVTDYGAGALQSYTPPTPAAPAFATIYINNADVTPPALYTNINGVVAPLGSGVGAARGQAVFTAGSTTGTLPHNLGSIVHSVECRTVSDGSPVYCPVTKGANSDTLTFTGGLRQDTQCSAK